MSCGPTTLQDGGGRARSRPILGQQPTKFELIVNRKAAKDANFTVPQTIMIAPTRSPNELRYFRNCRLCRDASVRRLNWRPPSFQTEPAVSPIGTSAQLGQCGDMQKLI